MATTSLPSTQRPGSGDSNRFTPGIVSSDSEAVVPSSEETPEADGQAGGSVVTSSITLPEINSSSKRSNSSTPKRTSPLSSGEYEKQLLSKLGDLHREGYTPKLMTPKQGKNNNQWKDMAGEQRHQRVTVGATSVDPPMERANKLDQKDLRLRRLRANRLLLKFEREMSRGEDFDGAISALVEARMHFQEAKEYGKVADVSALLARKHGDRAASQLKEARKQRDYTACSNLCAEALHYYKVLADLTFLERDLPPGEVRRREENKVLFRQFTSPHNVARKYASDDGEESLKEAMSLIGSDLDKASLACEDAKKCFKWLANDEEDRVLSGTLKFSTQHGIQSLIKLEEIEQEIKVAKFAKGGDGGIEKVSSSLTPYFYQECATLDDALMMESQVNGWLSEAQECYAEAQDKAGVEVVARLRRCAALLKEVNKSWFGLCVSLEQNDYATALFLLHQLRTLLETATAGLPSLNAPIDTVLRIVATPNTDANIMIVTFALEDGINFVREAKKCLQESVKKDQDSALLAQAAGKAKLGRQALEYAIQQTSSEEEDANLNNNDGENDDDTVLKTTMGRDEDDNGKDPSDKSGKEGGEKEEGKEKEVENEQKQLAEKAMTYMADWEQGYTDEGALKGSLLLQKFINTFPELKGPKEPLDSQRFEKRVLAQQGMEDLEKFDRVLSRKSAYSRAREKVSQFLSDEETQPFCEETSTAKFQLLEEALSEFSQCGFQSEVEVVESLYHCRKGDLLFELANKIHQPGSFTSSAIIKDRKDINIDSFLEEGSSSALKTSANNEAQTSSNNSNTPNKKNGPNNQSASCISAELEERFDKAWRYLQEAKLEYEIGGDLKACCKMNVAQYIISGDKAASPVSNLLLLSEYSQALNALEQAKHWFDKAIQEDRIFLTTEPTPGAPPPPPPPSLQQQQQLHRQQLREQQNPSYSVQRQQSMMLAPNQQLSLSPSSAELLEEGVVSYPLWWSPDSVLASTLRREGDESSSRFASQAAIAAANYGGDDLTSRRSCCSGPQALICSRARGDAHAFKAKALQIVCEQNKGQVGNSEPSKSHCLNDASRYVDLARGCFRWAVGAEPPKPPVRPGVEDEDDPEGLKRWRRACADRPGYKGGDELVLECEEAVCMAEEYWKGDSLLKAAKQLLAAIDSSNKAIDLSGDKGNSGAVWEQLEKAAEVGVSSRNEAVKCLELAKEALDRSGRRFVNMLEARAEIDDEIKQCLSGVTTENASAAYGCLISPQTCVSKEALLLEKLCVVYFDGAAVEECERLLQCLAADADCSTVQQLVRSKLFADASSVLLRSKAVFEKAGDEVRRAKVEKAEELVESMKLYDSAISAMEYDEAVTHLQRASKAVTQLPEMPPRTLVCATPLGLSQGVQGRLGLPDKPRVVVVKLAVNTGVHDCSIATNHLKKNKFDLCRAAITRSRKSYQWYQSQKTNGFITNNEETAESKAVLSKLNEDLNKLEVSVEAAHATARGKSALKSCITHLEQGGLSEEIYILDRIAERAAVEGELNDDASSLSLDSLQPPTKATSSSKSVTKNSKSKLSSASNKEKGTTLVAKSQTNKNETEVKSPSSRVVTKSKAQQGIKSPKTTDAAAAGTLNNGDGSNSDIPDESTSPSHMNQESHEMLVITAWMVLEGELLLPNHLGGSGPGWHAAALVRGDKSCEALLKQDKQYAERLLDEAQTEFYKARKGGGDFIENADKELSLVKEIRTKCEAVQYVAEARALFNSGEGIKNKDDFVKCVETIQKAVQLYKTINTEDGVERGHKSASSSENLIDLLSCERFLCRIQADEIMARYKVELNLRNYDASLELLKEATSLYVSAFPAPPGHDVSYTSSGTSHGASGGGGGFGSMLENSSNYDNNSIPPQSPSGGASISANSNLFSLKTYYLPEDPLSVVKAQAIKDGDQAKRRAGNTLTSLEDPVGSRAELKVASDCFRWAGVSEIERGVTAVEEDIYLFETRKAAEKSSETSFHKYKEMKYEESLSLMRKAFSQYDQAGETKRASELKEVAEMIKTAQSLLVLEVFASDCLTKSKKLSVNSSSQQMFDAFHCEPKRAVLVAQAAKPTFLSMAAVRSSGLRKWSSSATQSVDQLQHATTFLLALQTFQTHLLDKQKVGGDSSKFADLLFKDLDVLMKQAEACIAMERPGVTWSLPLTLAGIDCILTAAKTVAELFKGNVSDPSSLTTSSLSPTDEMLSPNTQTVKTYAGDGFEEDIPEEIVTQTP